MKPDEKFEGTNILRNEAVAKDDIAVGEVVSIGTKITEGYEAIKLGVFIDYFTGSAKEVSVPDDKENKYYLIRIEDAIDIV